MNVRRRPRGEAQHVLGSWEVLRLELIEMRNRTLFHLTLEMLGGSVPDFALELAIGNAEQLAALGRGATS